MNMLLMVFIHYSGNKLCHLGGKRERERERDREETERGGEPWPV